MKKFFNTAKVTALVAALLVGALAVGCDNGGGGNGGVALGGVAITGAVQGGVEGVYTLAVGLGSTVTLTSAPLPGTAVVTEWTWVSGTPTVASISSGTGNSRGVTGVALGEAVITVTAAGRGGPQTATITVTVIPPLLGTPASLALQRGPAATTATANNTLSWGAVSNSEEYIVFAFRDAVNTNEYHESRVVADGTSLNLRTAFAYPLLSDGPFFFRVQAVGDGVVNSSSALSDPVGPFWMVDIITPNLTPHYRDPAAIAARINDPTEAVIIIDVRDNGERNTTAASRGRIVGDFHIVYPTNDPRLTEVGGWDGWQERVLTALESTIATLSPEAIAGLNPDRRDITIFVFCAGGVRTQPAGFAIRSLGFTNVFDIGGFNSLMNAQPMLDANLIERFN